MADVCVFACRPEPGYQLWLRFDDGLQGRVYLGGLLDIGAFRLWRDVREFQRVHVDPATAGVTWEAGIRLDSDVLYQDIAARGGKRAPHREADEAFQRFMQAALAAPAKRRRRKGTRPPRAAPDA